MTHFASSSWEPELFWPSNVCDKEINVKQFTKMLKTKNERSQWDHDINKKRDLYLFCQNWNLQPTIFYNYTWVWRVFKLCCKLSMKISRMPNSQHLQMMSQLWYQCLVLVHAQTVLCPDEQHNKLLLHLKRQDTCFIVSSWFETPRNVCSLRDNGLQYNGLISRNIFDSLNNGFRLNAPLVCGISDW